MLKFLPLLILFSCQDYNVNSFDATLYGGPSREGVAKIMQVHCLNCHGAWANYSDQDWIDAQLVIPGNPQNSQLILNLVNVGGTMPIGGSALPNDEYQMLVDWIENLQ